MKHKPQEMPKLEDLSKKELIQLIKTRYWDISKRDICRIRIGTLVDKGDALMEEAMMEMRAI